MALVKTDVSPKRGFLQEPHGVTTKKTAFFIVFFFFFFFFTWRYSSG
jgi:hypothetical protein